MYSLVFRKKVLSVREKENLPMNDLYCVGWGVKLYSPTHSMKEVSQKFCVGKASVMRWSKSLIPKVPQKSPAKLNWEAIKRDVEENRDSYIRERAAKFEGQF